MKPEMIEMFCPSCFHKNNSISASMGDKTIKCKCCGKYMKYSYRKKTITPVQKPNREFSSGTTLY